MAATPDFVPDQERAPGTLGEVLYAGTSKVLVSEGEWVVLIRAVAAADQGALHALYERSHRAVFTLAMRITANRETAEEVTLEPMSFCWPASLSRVRIGAHVGRPRLHQRIREAT